MPARRICILGPTGAGKTLLADPLSAKLGLPVIYLDIEHWGPDFAKPDKAEWLDGFAGFAQWDRWIMDGNFFDTIEPRLARADVFIVLDVSVREHMAGMALHTLKYLGRARPGLGSKERLTLQRWRDASTYVQRTRPRFERLE